MSDPCYWPCTNPGTLVVVGHEDANHDGVPLCPVHAVAAVADALAADPEAALRVEPVGFFPY